MSLDVIPQECHLGGVGGCGYNSPDSQRVCVYSCPMEGKCPCAPKTPEPCPEVLEENHHQKEIRNISRSTQKLVYELQHAKMKLAVLKLTQEMEQLSSTAPLQPAFRLEIVEPSDEEVPIIEEEVFEKSW